MFQHLTSNFSLNKSEGNEKMTWNSVNQGIVLALIIRSQLDYHSHWKFCKTPKRITALPDTRNYLPFSYNVLSHEVSGSKCLLTWQVSFFKLKLILCSVIVNMGIIDNDSRFELHTLGKPFTRDVSWQVTLWGDVRCLGWGCGNCF